MTVIMTNDNLKCLLSPARSGTLFAPFRTRSANPAGFDSKMKIWIHSIEEWASGRLTLNLEMIHQSFVSETGVRPDRECIRLVFSEMKRKSKLIPLKLLKNSINQRATNNYLDNIVNPQGWIGWSVKKLTSWVASTIASQQDETYSDLTDMTITDSMMFVCQQSLVSLSKKLHQELVRISKAEMQACFEYNHLLGLISTIIDTIVDTPDPETIDLLFDYLIATNRIGIKIDNDIKLVKISDLDEPSEPVVINQKDVAVARLLKAKELLTSDVDKYLEQAQRAKEDALQAYNRKETTKAKSLLRSHKRLNNCAEQKDAQLRNVEELLDRLDNTDSNMLIMQAYKDGAEALKKANMSIMEEVVPLNDYLSAAESILQESSFCNMDDLHSALAELEHNNAAAKADIDKPNGDCKLGAAEDSLYPSIHNEFTNNETIANNSLDAAINSIPSVPITANPNQDEKQEEEIRNNKVASVKQLALAD